MTLEALLSSLVRRVCHLDLVEWVGKMTRVKTNVKIANQCWTNQGLGLGLDIVIQGGSFRGLSLALLGILAVFVLVELYKLMLTLEEFGGDLGYFAKVYQLPTRIRTLCSKLSLDTGGDVNPLLFSAKREVVFPRWRPLSVQPFQS